jgi:hypothetical protein
MRTVRLGFGPRPRGSGSGPWRCSTTDRAELAEERGVAEPDAEVHSFVNDLEQPVGTHLYGRRMYETMAVWQTVGDEPGLPAAEADFAEVWRGPRQGRVLRHARRRVDAPNPARARVRPVEDHNRVRCVSRCRTPRARSRLHTVAEYGSPNRCVPLSSHPMTNAIGIYSQLRCC